MRRKPLKAVSPKFFGLLLLLLISISYSTARIDAQGCSFASTSDGSDGTYDLSSQPAGTVVYFKASDFHGNAVVNNIFNFNKIVIPANVTVRFTENVFHGPVYWLAQSDVTIAGTIDLSGNQGSPSTATPESGPNSRTPAAAGSGGYDGGVGGGDTPGFLAMPGYGPGGGTAGNTTTTENGGGGTLAGTNDFLIPLVGGSGGGGEWETGTARIGAGGGGGGGAILIASSTSITVTGTINVSGGTEGATGDYECGAGAGGGSAGAIRLVATTISGTGGLRAGNTPGGCGPGGGSGIVRVEACSLGITSQNAAGTFVTSTPIKLLLPTLPVPSIIVTSVAGHPINANPFNFPDATINTSSPVPVVITAHQVPVGTMPTLNIFSGSGDQQLTCPSPGLQGTVEASTCTINVTFVQGGSQGVVRATWTP